MTGERSRILRAAEQIVAEQGSGTLAVEEVCSAIGVSRAAFRRSFAGRDEMLVALHDELAARVRTSMSRAYESKSSWLEGVRAAVVELLTTLEGNIPLARFMLLDCAVDEGPLPARRAALLADFARDLERDRPADDPGEAPPPFGASAMIGAVAAVLHGRLMEEPVPALGDLAGPLTGLLVMPYLGPEAARAEIARELGHHPRARRRPRRSGAASSFRLTIHTVGALRAISEQPGLSNTEIARATGITDAAQASRLLARLRAVGLIDCEPGSGGRPVGKAWRLTSAGRSTLAQSRRAA